MHGCDKKILTAGYSEVCHLDDSFYVDSLDYLLDISPWTQELSAEQMRKVRAAIRCRSYVAGAVICRRGDPADIWLGVCEGIVKLSVSSASGKHASLATGIPKGSWLGEGSLLKREIRKYDVVALRHTTIAFMPAETFFWLLNESIPFNQFLLRQVNERLGQFMGYMENDRLLSPEARVARGLASMFNPQLYPGSSDELKLSQEELGCLSGISRQRVNKALNVLQEKNIVAIDYGTIRIIDFDALLNFGQDDE
ncbi:Crp/Fnr family transcriptional regulator [Sedimenticola sp.]|uniref:Crp/Fnr family transcriptional regulator n=1 Tax=Sedimenticola sp. TaxID=1940285 RepID=UPI003D0EA2C7